MIRHAFVACLGSLLACAGASASVLTSNDSSSSVIWAIPAGTNLLAGAVATPTPATVQSPEATSTSWSILTNGNIGVLNTGVLDKTTVVTPAAGNQIIYALDVSGAHPAGYKITSFDSYGQWNDAGRNQQKYTLSYATLAAPTTWITIASVNNGTDGNSKSSHTRLTDATGHLALNTAAIRIKFENGQESGFCAYSELVLTDAPLAVNTVNESNSTNVWALPIGTNLLGAASLDSPTPNNQGGATSSSWSTLTDGQLGTALTNSTNLAASVSPSYGQSVIFPLNLTTNTKGYDLSSLDFYGAWDSGRDDLNIAVSYSTWDSPTVFQPLANVGNNNPGGNPTATHTRLTPVAGVLASGVAAVRFYFPGQDNNWSCYREFIASGQAASLTTPITWTGNSGSLGNANWITGTDSNWTPGDFDATSPLNFTTTGINRNITVPTALFPFSMTSANSAATPYAFSGAMITIGNGITSATGDGAATFNGPVKATTGVVLSGAGSLIFNGDLDSPGNVYMGSAVSSGDFVYLSMGADNQFGADSVLHLANLTYNNSNAWVNLRVTSQTIAGMDAPTNAAFSIIQNDYSTTPDYVANPALAGATLTINTPEFSTHSFYGLIRDGVSGAPVSIVKTGSLSTIETTPGGLIVRWAERANSSYVLQESTTLLDPWPTSAVVSIDAVDQEGLYSVDYVRKQATIPVDVSTKFVRVQAVRNP